MTIDEEITGRFRNDYHRGIINLTYTVNQLNYQFMQYLKQHKLSEPQYNILRVLRGYRSGGPISISFIKERMLDKNSDVSRIVDKLFEQGLISRSENGADRRIKDIQISQKGLELIETMKDCISQEDKMLKNLNTKEITELNRLLDKIRD